MVIPRPGGRILLCSKSFYPAEIYRLPTGGIKPGETPEQAFIRECREETGLECQIHSYLGRIDYILARCEERRPFASHVFLAQPTSEKICPQDGGEQFSGWREVEPRFLYEAAAQLEGLVLTRPEWGDWGRFRSIAHKFVAEKLKGL